MDDMYLENLDEYINDENKIVTYKWLSHTLSVHVNQAKQMLYTFVQKQRNEKNNDCLCVTYFLSGVENEGDSQVQCSRIVREEQLSAARSRLQPVTSCHVYSVSKVKVKDSATLYAANYDVVKEHIMNSNKYSAIQCKQARIRSETELEALRKHAQPTTEAPSFAKSTNNQTSSKSQPAKKQGGIQGMFAGTQNKKKETKSPTENSVKTEPDKPAEHDSKKNTTKQSKGAIANFFSNQASKPKKAKETEQKKNDVEEKENDNSKTKISASNKKSPRQEGKGRKKARESSDDDEVQQKKRRRIKKAVISDSSDDEPEMEVEAAPTPPPTPPAVEPEPQCSPEKTPAKSTPKQIKSPQQTKRANESSDLSENGSSVKRRKRQKKLVSKSFVDEGGYMVTEKVLESGSETDDDEIIPPTPPVSKPKPTLIGTNKDKKAAPAKKASPGKKGTKQASLMSFFKKK